ncbi:GGDEF domain-containing protein [Motilimonas cestriensis]|uniref:GGDEF domain-containing protein n=1 Tax=Motilimonas cestriensis TaxID=2742685 RepID=A0ABS8W7C9_9GAMM|nr:GGDEF domain-containing protein [Motilimonas cestriensis]MCE2593719.1 GGDEF domain-containing protein [Motilimonas cestriensis]
MEIKFKNSEIEQIIEQRKITILLQPIVDTFNGPALGYEALSRGPSNSRLHAPLQLFQAAEDAHLLPQLELTCIEAALEKFKKLDLKSYLFINLSAKAFSLVDIQDIERLLNRYQVAPQQLVLELTEQHQIDCHASMQLKIRQIKERGIAIAIDDLGAGYSGLRTWSELQPDFIKVDRYFASGLDKDPIKRQFLRSICQLAYQVNCKMIVEGIERPQELKITQSMGIQYCQGYLFSPPQDDPARSHQWAHLLLTKNTVKSAFAQQIGSLLLYCEPALPTALANEIMERFLANPALNCIPVVENQRAIGLVKRQDLLNLFSGRYGRELYGRKRISELMYRQPLIVESNMDLTQVSTQLTENTELDLELNFIICNNGHYLGIGAIRDLMRQLTQYQLKLARHANPLTLLPGNVPVNQTLQQYLRQGASFQIAYFDLNNFKPFNDCYGYSKGDEAINLLANILKDKLKKDHNFLGHVGGDDFVALLRDADWKACCQQVIDEFDNKIISLYKSQHISQNGITGVDRKGQRSFFPIMGLAVGIVCIPNNFHGSAEKLTEYASLAKKYAKESNQSQMYLLHAKTKSNAASVMALS